MLLFESVVGVVTVEDCLRVNHAYLHSPVPDDALRHHCEIVLQQRTNLAPDFLVLNDQCPFTVLTEPPFLNFDLRADFEARVAAIAETCLPVGDCECIALALNANVWGDVEFEPAPPNGLNSYGIEETLSKKKGSCTSMSVFLVTALRLAGCPSRVAGVPHWNLPECDSDADPACGNHNWVEVWTGGWSFIDQRRPDKLVLPLNQSWFHPNWTIHNSVPHRGNHSIYAASFMRPETLPVAGDPADWFPMAWDSKNHQVHAWDVSAAYARDHSLVFRHVP